MRNTFLVCYDICDERRLAKVHKTMRGFGDHLTRVRGLIEARTLRRVACPRVS